MPLDRLGRPLRDLRISVTDRCNLRCPYCMPREVFGPGFAFLERRELLTFEEITRIARALADLGVVKIRLTGGEPLLRRELERLVEVVSAEEILYGIRQRWALEELPPSREGEVASRYRYCDGAGEIGVIHSVSKPFCGGCTRARLSADGKLYTCLFATGGHDLRALVRTGAGEEQLTRRLREIWGARADRYSAQRSASAGLEAEPGEQPPKIEMSYIGG